MLSVKVMEWNDGSEPECTCTFSWNGKEIIVDPPDAPDANLLDEPALQIEPERKLLTREDGEAFLRALYTTYHGSRSWCTEAVDDGVPA
jgi:hypothetical protein